MQFEYLPSEPILIDIIPNELYDSLFRESKEVFNKTKELKNKDLAGHIKHEYTLKNNMKVLQPYIKKLSSSLANKLHPHDKQNYKGDNFVLKDLWVNFQKKYEFNPIHVHSGLFSFVIVMQIPFELNDEMNMYEANGNVTSKLQFVINSSFSRLCTYDMHICKSDQKKIFFFPASLNHIVYPFYTSDNYRITISGNVYGE
jgi:hypothetical protein